MARKKANEVDVVEKEVATNDADSVTVTCVNSVRVFSKEVHGDDFKELAESFAKKFNGTLS